MPVYPNMYREVQSQSPQSLARQFLHVSPDGNGACGSPLGFSGARNTNNSLSFPPRTPPLFINNPRSKPSASSNGNVHDGATSTASRHRCLLPSCLRLKKTWLVAVGLAKTRPCSLDRERLDLSLEICRPFMLLCKLPDAAHRHVVTALPAVEARYG